MRPTPWIVGKGYEQEDPGVYIADANGLVIYSDAWDSPDGGGRDVDLTEDLANIIVAAVNAQARGIAKRREMWVIEGTLIDPYWVPVRGPSVSDRSNKR